MLWLATNTLRRWGAYGVSLRLSEDRIVPNTIQKLDTLLTYAHIVIWLQLPSSSSHKKLAPASILKTCQFFTSVPNGISGCFWMRGILISKRTQSTSTLSFHVCTSISGTSRIFLAHASCIFCHPLAYFTFVNHIWTRNWWRTLTRSKRFTF